EPSLAALERWRVSYLIDPIIEPIGFGFFASLERFAEVHRRHPTAPLFMGIGNITELTAADTTGVNALLIAMCEELGVRAVLTTEVIPWARGVVREVDIARRLMHHAVARQTLPKAVDDRLVTLGKNYRQEGALEWGYLTPPDDRGPEHVRLTQRSRRSRERRKAKGGA